MYTVNISAKFEVRSFTRWWDNVLEKIWAVPGYIHAPFSPKFLTFARINPVNIPAKFEVCSFTHSWDNRGTVKIWAVPGHAHTPFSRKFLTGFCSDRVNIPAKFEVCSSTRSWDNRGYWTNYVMTSPLTSRSLHRLSMWTFGRTTQ